MLQQPLTIIDQQQVEADVLSRCLEGCCLVDFTSLLIHESVDTAGGRTIVVGNLHDDLVVFATRLDHKLVGWCLVATDCTVVAGLEVLLQGITQHQGVLTDVQLNGVAGVLLGSEVSELSAGHACLSIT